MSASPIIDPTLPASEPANDGESAAAGGGANGLYPRPVTFDKFIARVEWVVANAAAPSPPPPTTVDLRITPVPGAWYVKLPPPRQYLLRDVRTEPHPGVLPRGRVGLFVAPGAGGKTMALCQMAVAIASGTPWLAAWGPERSGRVLIVLAEEDTEEVQRRLYQAARIAGVQPADGSIHFAALSGVDCALLGKSETGDPTETPYLTALRERVASERYDLVILDPLSRFAGGEAETLNAWATRLISAFESIATTSGATVLVSHHTPQWSRVKSGDQETRHKAAMRPDAITARGVTALTDGARWMAALTVERLEDEEGEDTGLVTVTIALAKTNYGRAELPPIICRRSDEHGGALEPLDEEGLQLLKQAFEAAKAAKAETATAPIVRKHRTREELKDESERKKTERRKGRQAEREAEKRQRDDDDDAAARRILAANPQASIRSLMPLLEKERACGTTRAFGALSRVKG